MNMNTNQFTRDEGYEFQIYNWHETVETDIGEFNVEIQIMDDSPLNNDLIDLASRLSESGKRNTKRILDIIYQSYKECDPEWLNVFDIPSDLSPAQIMSHVESMSFVVAKDPGGERNLDSYIHIRPEWDEEHTIYIRCEGDAFTVFDPMSGE